MPRPDRHPRRKYGADQLRLVLCQVRFPVLHRFNEPALQATIQEALRSRYPRVQQEQQMALTVGPSGPVATPGDPLWRYQDLDGAWSVVMQRDAAGLETTAYDRYEDFASHLESVLDLLRELGVGIVERVGLRYINELRHSPARRPDDWAELVRKELLGIVRGSDLRGDILHAIQDIRLRRPDGTLVIRHGFVGSQSADPSSSPYYLLDLDYFDDERARHLATDQVLEQLRAYHDEISRIFEMTITDDMRRILDDRGPIVD